MNVCGILVYTVKERRGDTFVVKCHPFDERAVTPEIGTLVFLEAIKQHVKRG